jgi:hypothetical protein
VLHNAVANDQRKATKFRNIFFLGKKVASWLLRKRSFAQHTKIAILALAVMRSGGKLP